MSDKIEIEIEAAADVLEELMDALSNGTISEVILTRRGKPAARLVATEPD